MTILTFLTAVVLLQNPVHSVCPELQVKIADLGNACWEVRLALEKGSTQR